MLPYLNFHLFGSDFHLHTNTWIMGLYAVFAILAFSLSFRKEKKVLASLFLALTVAVGAFFGARLFHLLVEKPISEFSFDQMLRFDGMTFYGSLIAGLLLTFILVPFLYRREHYAKIADLAAILTAAGYGVIRIGCFANGCCWGRLSAVPWAVRYTESTVMPALGLPVHPVQLYDSFVGFLIAGVLLYLRTSKRTRHEFAGLLMPIFLIAYSIGRMITEFYRGDTFRGEHVFLIFSTSQTISLVVAFLGAVALVVLLNRRRTPNVPSHA